MSVSGTWNCVTDTPMGKQKSALTLVEDAGTLSGENVSAMGASPVADGSVDGNAVTFTTAMTVPFPMTLTWVFAIDGDMLAGEVEAGPFGKSPLTGTRA
jgi:hypothetical protein